jgi:ABC-type uncharacterized transport system involved in gliding motility auxiliary subunit
MRMPWSNWGKWGKQRAAGRATRGGPDRTGAAARRVRYGVNAVVLTCAVVGILVLVNAAAAGYRVRVDLTGSRQFSLSDQTRQVLRALDKDVKVTAFLQPGNALSGRIQDLLEEYDYASGRVTVQFVDPEKNPSLAKSYDITEYDTTVFECAGRVKKVPLKDAFTMDMDPQTIQFTGEQAFTRAVTAVTRERQAVAYFLEGHEEMTLDVQLGAAHEGLEGEGFTVQTLNVARIGEVPADATMVIIAGPQRDITPDEAQRLSEYMDRGGRVLALVDPLPEKGTLVNLGAFLARCGVALDDDIVVDPERSYFYDPLTPVPGYAFHSITAGLIERNLAMALPRARSLRLAPGYDGPYDVTKLLWASQQAWGETTFNAEPGLDEDDIKGALELAFIVRDKADQSTAPPGSEPEEGKPHAVVVGDASFAGSDWSGFQGNLDFFLNSVNWLAGEREMIAIRAKDPQFNQVFMSGDQARRVFYSTVLGIPVAVLIVGTSMWLRRRTL